jgi:hypothetical protein
MKPTLQILLAIMALTLASSAGVITSGALSPDSRVVVVVDSRRQGWALNRLQPAMPGFDPRFELKRIISRAISFHYW